MTVGGVRQTKSNCSASGGAQCKINSEIPGDRTLISLLDPPGTVATIDNAQAQAEFLSAYCRQGALGKCGFKVSGPSTFCLHRISVLSPPHQVGNTVRNLATNPTPLTKTLSIADAVTAIASRSHPR